MSIIMQGERFEARAGGGGTRGLATAAATRNDDADDDDDDDVMTSRLARTKNLARDLSRSAPG